MVKRKRWGKAPTQGSCFLLELAVWSHNMGDHQPGTRLRSPPGPCSWLMCPHRRKEGGREKGRRLGDPN